MSLLKGENLIKDYYLGAFLGRGRRVRAVDGVSLDIIEGETLGLVGESGCGKSTLGRLLVRLETVTSGSVYYDNMDITNFTQREMRELRKCIQIIFQNNLSSLNPRLTVRSIIEEPLMNFAGRTKKERSLQIGELLDMVGLSREYGDRYPHELSGGERQRVNTARALALNPRIIVCDEPVSSLDVSVQAQILNLLKDLKKRLNLSLLFISHDLAAVDYISDRIAVMYLGKIVEIFNVTNTGEEGCHPYTRMLMAALPEIGTQGADRKEQHIAGEPNGSELHLPGGCSFYPRCSLAAEKCRVEEPGLRPLGNGHFIACHLFDSSH